MLSLSVHLSIHIFFALLAGFIVWLFFRKPPHPQDYANISVNCAAPKYCGCGGKSLYLALLGGILGGFMVDFDHFIDYFLAFGWNFNLYWFIKGYEFLKIDKIHLFFHAWEYVIMLIISAIVIKNRLPKTKLFLFSLALGLLFHLTGDVIMNEGLMIKSYSMIYKIKSGFMIERLVTPEHYQYDVNKRNDPKIREIISQ